MNVITNNEPLTAKDDLVFITPYQQPQAGPYIYDKKGVSDAHTYTPTFEHMTAKT